MAKVFVTQRKGRQSFYLAWRQDGKQKMRPVGSSDRDVAERAREAVQSILDGRDRTEALMRLLVEAGRPEMPDPRIRVDQVTEFYEQQRETRRVKERTLKDKVGKVEVFIEWLQKTHPEIVYLHELTDQLAGEYMRHLYEQGCSGQTQNNHLSALRSVWSTIRIPAYLPGNPWEAVQRVEAVHQNKQAFTLEQIQKLYAQARKFESEWPGFWPAAIALGFHTGLRLGDVIELEAEEYCREEGVLRLVPNKTWKKGQPLVLPLHRDFDRWIPDVESGRFWPQVAKVYYGPGNGQELFAEWRTLLKSALGLESRTAKGENRKKRVARYGFHSLRHTYVSLARQQGAPIDDIQYAVGHGSPMMTRHYDQSRDAAARTGELMPALASN